ncbi:MAG: hypothetical protein QHC90_13160 [Shinella sp.]|nr:hypothetical protein [Shinella sp.]
MNADQERALAVARARRKRAEAEQSPANGGESPAPAPRGNLVDAGVTWLENAASGIPIVGPTIQKASDFIGSNIQGLITGENPAQIRAGLDDRREERNEAYPASAVSGNIAGNIAAMGAIGTTAAGAEALGITGAKLVPRMWRSAGSSALISSADTAARGGDVADIATRGGVDALVGGSIPAIGAGVRAGLGAIGDRVSPTINAVLNPTEEAARRVGSAVQRDRLAGNTINQMDEGIARSTNIPLLNVDRGGETTRALARSVANQSPEARQAIIKAADDRFATQGVRAANVVRRIAGGAIDDIGYQEAIRDTARAVNKPAYDRAFKSAPAQQLYTPGLQELMQSPSVRNAVSKVPKRSADRGAVEGFKEIGNPFTKNSQGAYVLRREANGRLISPNLQFWDQVKKNLDSDIGKAARAGDQPRVADLTALKSKLVKELDEAVPAYKSARQGAAAYFGAEDSIEAGKKFATQSRMIPEARKAYERFSPAEKAGFQIGYASELIDRIKAVGDRTNVINSVFKSQASRESMELVFGPQKTRALEAYIRVEDLADRLRGAMGNSTTARQLVEMGLGAGGGFAISGNTQGAAAGALLTAGGRLASQRANSNVMKIAAEMLTSDNPKLIESAIKQAEKSPAFMGALESLGNMLAVPARAVGTSIAQ